MNIKIIQFLGLLIGMLGTAVGSDHQIPLNVLFGNPDITHVRISPNGTTLAYLKSDQHRRLQVWVQDLETKQEQQITNNQHKSITNFFWACDSQYILYLQDELGNENWNLFKVNIQTHEGFNLTPFDNVQVRILKYNCDNPQDIVVGINQLSKSRHDPYRINIATGDIQSLGIVADNTRAILINNAYDAVIAFVALDDGSCEVQLKTDTGSWQTFLHRSYKDSLYVLGFSLDNRYIYCFDDAQTDTLALVKMDLQNSEYYEIMAVDSTYDIDSVNFDIVTKLPLIANFNKEKMECIALDQEIQKDIEYLQGQYSGSFSIVSSTHDAAIWIVAYSTDVEPVSYYMYHRASQTLEFLFYNRENLLKYQLQPMHPIEFAARDGLSLHGYITYPINYQPKQSPLVLVVHGGPWCRDSWGYDAMVQWLANRGYVVLQINFRGSSGYGKTFLHAGDKQWGKKMLDDLVDGVVWATQMQDIANADRVAILGASYGGYAALCGATFTKNVFTCAVDICGRSNVMSRFTSIPPYWKNFIAIQKHLIGDPETDAELFKEISPLFHADQIEIPLFIAHGTRDARVNSEESDQIVAKLQENNIPYEYLNFKDEGHSFIKEENRLHCFERIEKFLQKYL